MAFVFGYSNLVVKNTLNFEANKVDMTADWIEVGDGVNTLRVPMTTTIKIDKSDATQTSTMVNGRDQAATFPVSTWIYIWAIYNPVTNTIAGLFSLSSSSPTLPSGYTHKALVGAVYSQPSTGNFALFHQKDSFVIIPEAGAGLSGGTSTTAVSFSIAEIVPPSAVMVFGRAGAVAGGNSEVSLTIQSDSSGYGSCFMMNKQTTLPVGLQIYSCWRTMQKESGKLYYYVHADNTAGIYITGWEY